MWDSLTGRTVDDVRQLVVDRFPAGNVLERAN